MPFFLSPRIIYGKGSIEKLCAELEGRGSRAAIITERNLKEKCSRLMEGIRAAGYEVIIWDGVEADPTLDIAVEASRFLLDSGPQWVIGFGGGSAIDTAKAAWVLYERPDLIAGDLTKAVLPKARLNLRRKARFAAVPTTSGTGADVTWVAVLTDRVTNRKIVFAHNDIVPDLSVLDPQLTLSLPAPLTSSTGLDVIAHAVDGYTSRQQNDFSDGLCLQALKMAVDWLPVVCRDGSNLKGREKMQNAATLAGLGFGNSNTGLSHALGHSVGAVFHLPHGRAVGIALPYSLAYIVSNPPREGVPDPAERLSAMARIVGINDPSPADAVKAFIGRIRSIQKEVGEPASLREAGISEDRMISAIETLVRIAESDPNMYTTPCECKGAALRELFEIMWQGEDYQCKGRTR